MIIKMMPEFRYHPDPLATRSVKVSFAPCLVCGLARGRIYVGPIYTIKPYDGEVCVWCVADGSAAEALEAGYTAVGEDVPRLVPDHVIDEIMTRTPGFLSWQSARWLFHCGDAAAFLGGVDYDDLRDLPGALHMLLHEHDHLGWSPAQSRAYVESIGVGRDRSAYLFRCLHCGRHLAYSDQP